MLAIIKDFIHSPGLKPANTLIKVLKAFYPDDTEFFLKKKKALVFGSCKFMSLTFSSGCLENRLFLNKEVKSERSGRDWKDGLVSKAFASEAEGP